MKASKVSSRTRYLCLALVCVLFANALPFLAGAASPADEDRDPTGTWTAWIESASTPKASYAPGETIDTTVTVERGPDALTAVWQGDLVLAVLDGTGGTVHYDDLPVELNVGGAQQTSHFIFDLDEASDYILRLSLYRFNDTMVDRMDLNLTVARDLYNKAPVAFIDPASQTVEVGALAAFDGGRSYDPDNDPTTLRWDLGDGTFADGANATHAYRAAGRYVVTLAVTDEHGATGTASAEVEVVERTPSPGDAQVSIIVLDTDAPTYKVGDTMDVSVAVRRGQDMLTHVWEGTLALELLDAEGVQLGTWERAVYLAQGGAAQNMSFAVDLDEAGPRTLVATLYWMDGALVDERRLEVTVTGDDPNRSPTAVIDPEDQTVAVGEEARLDGSSSSDVDGTIASFSWDLGDGTRAGGPTATHLYRSPGVYNVTLTVTDDDGAASVAYALVRVTTAAPGPVDREAWIASVDARGTVNEGENVTVNVTVVRGGDMLDYVWLGGLVLEVPTNGTVLRLTERVELATGGQEVAYTFELALTEPVDHLLRVALLDQDGELVDVEEVLITVVGSVKGPDERGVPELPTTAVAAAGMLVVLGALAATEVGKLSLLGLLMPLYTKLRKEDILEHFTRGKIYGYILANPGDHYNSIQKTLGIPNGTFAYHLHVLEKEGYIRSARYGTRRCFFPANMRVPPKEGALRAGQRLIVEKILEEPGISQRDIASALGVSSATVSYHIKGLLNLGVVETERRGMRLKYYINRDRIPSPA